MRRSDVMFFSIILGIMFLMFFIVVTNLFLGLLVYLKFFWVLLFPYIIVKLFFRKSKLFAWFDTEVCCKTIK